jgi:hypothetical protein
VGCGSKDGGQIFLQDSTQWDIDSAKAKLIEPAFEELVRQAAQGKVVHNDDTTVKMLEMMGKRERNATSPEDSADDSAKIEPSLSLLLQQVIGNLITYFFLRVFIGHVIG